MTPVEIIALIVIVIAVIKMVILLVTPMTWMNWTKTFYTKSSIAKIVSFILAVIVLYYLNSSGITIVQILAVSAFVFLLIIIGLASHVDYLTKRYEAQIKKGNLWKENWFYALLWIVLMLWGLKELFM